MLLFQLLLLPRLTGAAPPVVAAVVACVGASRKSPFNSLSYCFIALENVARGIYFPHPVRQQRARRSSSSQLLFRCGWLCRKCLFNKSVPALENIFSPKQDAVSHIMQGMGTLAGPRPLGSHGFFIAPSSIAVERDIGFRTTAGP